MALLQDRVPLAVVRRGSLLLSGPVAALLIFLAVGCQGEEAGREVTASPEQRAGPAPSVTVYSSPTCECCGEYEKYLEAEGFKVESVKTEGYAGIKEGLGIPQDMWSCHTVMVDEYYVEGHVPVEAIWKLVEEQPQIDGIALPGMPSGSPGMAGIKAQPFTIYSVVEGRIDEFLAL